MAIKNKYSSIDLSKYDKGYQKSKSVKDAEKQKTKAENLVKNYGDFKYGRQKDYSSAMDSLLNRKKFSYDLNADALYNQYKDQYMAQGKQAMMDTIGQASALTGGYGNSYAATVGNQTYQSYIRDGLNSIVPQLYQMALSSYQAEGDRLAQNFSVLSADRDAALGMWTDKLNRLIGDRDYYANNYNNAYTQDYSQYVDNRDYDTSQYWNEYNAGYQKERDAIADAQWQKQYDLSYYQAHKGGGGGGGDDTPNLKTPTQTMFREALDAYNSGGYEALMNYLDTIPGYETEGIMDHVKNNGSSTNASNNRVGNRDYRFTTSKERTAFDSKVREGYANRDKKR